MPNPGIALGLAPAWLTRLLALGWQSKCQGKGALLGGQVALGRLPDTPKTFPPLGT